VPQSSSSCIACHNNAVDTAGTPSDFTYILERAAH
jgi:cytochrome c551/c552